MKIFAISSLLALLAIGTNASVTKTTNADAAFFDAFFNDVVVGGEDANRKLRGGRGGGRGRGGGFGSGAADRTFSDFECDADDEIVECATKGRRGDAGDDDDDDDDNLGSVACFEKTKEDGEVVKRNVCVGDSVPNHRDGTPPTVNCGCCEGSCADVLDVCTTPCPDDADKVLVTNGTKEKCVTAAMATTMQLKTRGADWECV